MPVDPTEVLELIIENVQEGDFATVEFLSALLPGLDVSNVDPSLAWQAVDLVLYAHWYNNEITTTQTATVVEFMLGPLAPIIDPNSLAELAIDALIHGNDKVLHFGGDDSSYDAYRVVFEYVAEVDLTGQNWVSLGSFGWLLTEIANSNAVGIMDDSIAAELFGDLLAATGSLYFEADPPFLLDGMVYDLGYYGQYELLQIVIENIPEEVLPAAVANDPYEIGWLSWAVVELLHDAGVSIENINETLEMLLAKTMAFHAPEGVAWQMLHLATYNPEGVDILLSHMTAEIAESIVWEGNVSYYADTGALDVALEQITKALQTGVITPETALALYDGFLEHAADHVDGDPMLAAFFIASVFGHVDVALEVASHLTNTHIANVDHQPSIGGVMVWISAVQNLTEAEELALYDAYIDAIPIPTLSEILIDAAAAGYTEVIEDLTQSLSEDQAYDVYGSLPSDVGRAVYAGEITEAQAAEMVGIFVNNTTGFIPGNIITGSIIYFTLTPQVVEAVLLNLSQAQIEDIKANPSYLGFEITSLIQNATSPGYTGSEPDGAVLTALELFGDVFTEDLGGFLYWPLEYGDLDFVNTLLDAYTEEQIAIVAAPMGPNTTLSWAEFLLQTYINAWDRLDTAEAITSLDLFLDKFDGAIDPEDVSVLEDRADLVLEDIVAAILNGSLSEADGADLLSDFLPLVAEHVSVDVLAQAVQNLLYSGLNDMFSDAAQVIVDNLPEGEDLQFTDPETPELIVYGIVNGFTFYNQLTETEAFNLLTSFLSKAEDHVTTLTVSGAVEGLVYGYSNNHSAAIAQLLVDYLPDADEISFQYPNAANLMVDIIVTGLVAEVLTDAEAAGLLDVFMAKAAAFISSDAIAEAIDDIISAFGLIGQVENVPYATLAELVENLPAGDDLVFTDPNTADELLYALVDIAARDAEPTFVDDEHGGYATKLVSDEALAVIDVYLDKAIDLVSPDVLPIMIENIISYVAGDNLAMFLIEHLTPEIAAAADPGVLGYVLHSAHVAPVPPYVLAELFDAYLSVAAPYMSTVDLGDALYLGADFGRDVQNAVTENLTEAQKMTLLYDGTIQAAAEYMENPYSALSGNEIVTRNNGDNLTFGGAGNDIIYNMAGDDIAVGGTGNDQLWSLMGGNNILVGGDGDDLIWAGAGNDILLGGADDDIIVGGAGNDTMLGEDGNDIIRAQWGDDVASGGEGDDIITSVIGGNNHFSGDAGDDFLWTGAGDDTLSGGDGNDTLWGGAGDDILLGGDGYDIIQGGDGYDVIHGGAGDDEIWDGFGGGVFYGGDGSDIIVAYNTEFQRDDNSVTIYGGLGHDNISGALGDDILFGDEGDDFIQGSSGNDEIHGGDGADWLRGNGGNDIIWAGSGNDGMEGGSGDDVLYFGEGFDSAYGDGSPDDNRYEGGADTFVFQSGNTGLDTIYDFDMFEGDVLDFTDILSAFDPTQDALSDFITSTSNGTDTTIALDVDGSGTAAGFTDVVVLQGVDVELVDLVFSDSVIV